MKCFRIFLIMTELRDHTAYFFSKWVLDSHREGIWMQIQAVVYQGAVYGEKTGQELPFLPKYFSDVGFICFFVFGFLSMLLMVFFASSKKRI